MFYFLFILKSALEDFRRNKIRTFLTSLGILIGVSSVVLLMALGLGLKRYISEQFESLGTNLLVILPGKMFQGGNFRPGIGGARFDEKDIAGLKKIKHVSFVVPFYMKYVDVSSQDKSDVFELAATTADVFPVLNLEIDLGTAFDRIDVEKKSKKTVLGPKAAEKLFGSIDNALNKTVKIAGLGFKVTGIAKSKGGKGFVGPSLDDHLYIPYKSAYSFNPDKKFFTVYIKADEEQNLEQVKEEAEKILLKRYKEDDFSISQQTEILNMINSIFSILNLVLVAIAAISLIVGGIGIMNIMYVSVIEKVKEIGIRRAIGATRRDILLQFLLEAVILSLIGGLFGLIISFIIVSLIGKIFPAYIDLTSVFLALGVSGTIGIIFGVFPARRAANLSPIEAIRYE